MVLCTVVEWSLRMLQPRKVGDHFVLLPMLVVLKLLCLLVPEIVIYNTLY